MIGIKGRITKRDSIIAFIIIGVAILLVGCSTQAGSASDEGNSRPTISIMVPLHFPHPPSEEVIEILEQLTNTKLDLTWVPDGIYFDKMNTALTTNSMKKVTFVKHTDYTSVKNAIRTGAFWEIGPYLEQFPNLRYLDDNILGQAAVEHKIYGLYTERQSSRQGIILRKDWLDNLDLVEPTTIEELYEVLVKFTENDPDQNGQKDTIGLADRNDLIYGAFKTLSSYFGTPNNWDVVDGKFIPEFETAAYLDTMNFMKRLYKEQLMNLDFPVSSKDMQRELVIRGTAGVYIGSMTDVQRLYIEAQQFNPDVEFTVMNRIEGPQGYRVWSIPNYMGLYLFSKKAIPTEEELLQILSFFDRTMDKDIANLLHYGIEDKHYYVENGKVVIPKELSALRNREVNALFSLMIADISNPNLMKISEQDKLWEYAETLVEDNNKFIVRDPSLSLESITYDERGIDLYKIVSDATYNYMLGKIDEEGFQAQVNLWKQNGGQKIIDEFTAEYYNQ